MKQLHQVRLTGPENGKPQRGNVVWIDFTHADETRAHELGRILARRLSERTGHDIGMTVAPVYMVEENEAEILSEVDRLAEIYGGMESSPRRLIEGTMLVLDEARWTNDVQPCQPTGMASRMVEYLRNDHGIVLSDWIAMNQELADQDASSEWCRIRIVLSLPADQADMLMRHQPAVDAYDLRVVEEGDSTPSLYDDDARMEEIAADAEDAALNAWGPLGAPTRRANPHSTGSEEAEHWDRTFLSAYARENGK